MAVHGHVLVVANGQVLTKLNIEPGHAFSILCSVVTAGPVNFLAVIAGRLFIQLATDDTNTLTRLCLDDLSTIQTWTLQSNADHTAFKSLVDMFAVKDGILQIWEDKDQGLLHVALFVL